MESVRKTVTHVLLTVVHVHQVHLRVHHLQVVHDDQVPVVVVDHLVVDIQSQKEMFVFWEIVMLHEVQMKPELIIQTVTMTMIVVRRRQYNQNHLSKKNPYVVLHDHSIRQNKMQPISMPANATLPP